MAKHKQQTDPNTINPGVEKKAELKYVQRRFQEAQTEARRREADYRQIVGEILAQHGVQDYQGQIQVTDDLNIVLEGRENGAKPLPSGKKAKAQGSQGSQERAQADAEG